MPNRGASSTVNTPFRPQHTFSSPVSATCRSSSTCPSGDAKDAQTPVVQISSIGTSPSTRRWFSSTTKLLEDAARLVSTRHDVKPQICSRADSPREYLCFDATRDAWKPSLPGIPEED